MMKQFGNQFKKLLYLLVKQYLPKLVLCIFMYCVYVCTYVHTHVLCMYLLCMCIKQLLPFCHRIETVTLPDQRGPLSRLKQFIEVCFELQFLHPFRNTFYSPSYPTSALLLPFLCMHPSSLLPPTLACTECSIDYAMHVMEYIEHCMVMPLMSLCYHTLSNSLGLVSIVAIH